MDEIKIIYDNVKEKAIIDNFHQIKNELKTIRAKKELRALIIVKDITLLSKFSVLLNNSIILKINQKKTLINLKSLLPFILLNDSDDINSLKRKIENNISDDLTILENNEELTSYCLYIQILEDFSDNPYIFTNLNFLKNIFFIQDIVEIHDDYYLPLYSDLQFEEKNHHNITNYFIYGGYGDILLYIPILYYIQEKQKNGYSSIRYLVETDKNAELIKYFLPYVNVKKVKCLFSNQRDDFSYIINQLSNYNMIPKNPRLLNEKLFNNASTKNSLFEILCEIEIKTSLNPRYILNLYKKYFKNQKKPIKSFGKNINFKYWICIQRSSGNKNLPWNIIESLISLCHQNSIGVINIDPEEQNINKFDLNYGNCDLIEIFDLLRSVNAFVGIDSCFGHASALLNIPSVSCFVSSHIRNQALGPNFRPISNNYSFFPINPEAPKFDANRIFSVLYSILVGEKI